MALNIVVPKAPPAPALPRGIASDYSAIQEQYPSISAKIAQMWGSVTLQDYLNKIIIDDRGGRQGFPVSILSALMRLYEYHGSLVPDTRTGGTWDHVA